MPGFGRGLLVGALLGVAVTVIAGLWWTFGRPDPLDAVVATSRGGTMADHGDPAAPSGARYQVVISAEPDTDGYLVSGIVCIGGCAYRQDLGTIGRAESPADAVARFGDIRWEPEVITIGGRDGIHATIDRAQLEVHR